MSNSKLSLTDSFVRHHPAPEKKRIEVYDTVVNGLALRVTPTGHKSFVYRYRYNDKVKRFTIGTYPNMSLSIARDEARGISNQLHKGIDPLQEKKERMKPGKMFSELLEAFKQYHLPTLREKTADEYERIIDNEIKPVFGNKEIKEIDRHLIIKFLDNIAYKRGSKTMANRVRSLLSRIYTIGMEKAVTESNPVSHTTKYEGGENKRERYYEEEEIRRLWGAFEEVQEPAKSVLKLLLLTGQRSKETRHMKWENIKNGVWTIPKELAKGKREHQVPLSNLAVDVLKNLKPITGAKEYVFASPVNDNAPLEGIKRPVDDVREIAEVKDFRPHDLRRTVATYLAGLKVDRTTLGKLLNHKGIAGDNQVTAIYDRYDYLEEKRTALNRWASKLQMILDEEEEEQGKIIQIGA
ncbi:tyrosine-type recombinase/integrase [Rhodohalobacter sp. 614A]|uniref:tyrosine-type recombinase/integrase n=1 Tax=Rhodohalobacter sp. 614A TaxID=2908649 RepID=UPI001F2278DD|nr:site-specific integrase [Rhodohalobacter sp. 614A]